MSGMMVGLSTDLSQAISMKLNILFANNTVFTTLFLSFSNNILILTMSA